MEDSVRKKKKHWLLRILGLLLLVMLTALMILGIRLVQAADRLQRALASQNCAITLDISPDMRALTADQQKFIRILSGLTGVEEEGWQELTMQGGYDGKAVELTVYAGQDAEITQLYLTQDCQAINLHTIYDRAYHHLTEKVGLLALVLPQWSFGDYISLQQLEEAFDLELGKLPDVQGKLKQLQSKLNLPFMCGVILSADGWDKESGKLVYHIADGDRRIELFNRLLQKTGNSRQGEQWQLPEGMELDVFICLSEPHVRMEITGQMPGLEQLTDWSAELLWEGYIPQGDTISIIDQQLLKDLSELLKLLESLQDR